METHLLQQIEDYIDDTLPLVERVKLESRISQDNEFAQLVAFFQYSKTEENAESGIPSKGITLHPAVADFYREEKELTDQINTVIQHREYFEDRQLTKNAIATTPFSLEELNSFSKEMEVVSPTGSEAYTTSADSYPSAAAAATATAASAKVLNGDHLSQKHSTKKALGALLATLGFVLLGLFLWQQNKTHQLSKKTIAIEKGPIENNSIDKEKSPQKELLGIPPLALNLQTIPDFECAIDIETQLEGIQEKAEKHYRNKEYKEAFVLFEKVSQSPDLPKSVQPKIELFMAICQLKMGDSNYSIPVFERLAKEDNPNFKRNYKDMARFYAGAAHLFLNKDYTRAKGFLKSVENRNIKFKGSPNVGQLIDAYLAHIEAQVQ